MSSDLRIGDVFTPDKWSQFVVEKYGLAEQWLGGATIFDPTMGDASLLKAIVHIAGKASNKDSKRKNLPWQNLYGNELNRQHHQSALNNFAIQFGVDMSKNFSCADILELDPRPFDFLIGNPPWINFADLPDIYKAKIKPYFHQYDLVKNSQKLLWGGSRIDMAALIIKAAVQNFLKPHGQAIFFFPLSLLLNDGAHEQFRNYQIHTTAFAIEEILDFGHFAAFEKIHTRYGVMKIRRDRKIDFPIKYDLLTEKGWQRHHAKPIFSANDSLSIINGAISENPTEKTGFPLLQLSKQSQPRQGINSCGANHIFFFNSCLDIDDQYYLLKNKQQQDIRLPKQFVFPLISNENFNGNPTPQKWVLLPYFKDGKIIPPTELDQFPVLASYLESHRDFLSRRKGTVLRTQINKGNYYALLGVGAYNFLAHKIVWRAYGQNHFAAKQFSGDWQANQALQAYIPVSDAKVANHILAALNQELVESYLLSLKTAGTMNWAQPGKIRKMFDFSPEIL